MSTSVLSFNNLLYMQDLETLVQAQTKAEKDPLAFVEALKNGVSTANNVLHFMHRIKGFQYLCAGLHHDIAHTCTLDTRAVAKETACGRSPRYRVERLHRESTASCQATHLPT